MPTSKDSPIISTHIGKPQEEQQESNDNHNHFELLCDDDSEISIKMGRKRVQRFSDSESDLDEQSERDKNRNTVSKINSKDSSDDDDDYINLLKNNLAKSRIKYIGSDNSDSDSQQIRKENLSDSDSVVIVTKSNTNVTKNVEQQNRMKNKRNNLKEKFKSLLDSRERDVDIQKNECQEKSIKKSEKESESSSDEQSSIEKIKQVIQMRMSTPRMSICDPDTSDEESNKVKPSKRPKKQQKHTIPISPKPQRMSAKQAMENMHKIKSESNRMLREKEVSLPYHRPKALSLKDIMSRRKPALSLDGKALPIKMNGEQLRQYALLLEQRQKEIMELCKSDTDDDEPKNESVSNNTMEPNEQDNVAVLEMNTLNDEQCRLNIEIDKTSSDVEHALSISDMMSASSMTSEIDIQSSKTMKSNSEINEIGWEDNNSSGKKHDKTEDQNVSAEMVLVYNDHIEDTITDHETENFTDVIKNSETMCTEEIKKCSSNTASIVKEIEEQPNNTNCIKENNSTNAGASVEEIDTSEKIHGNIHSENNINTEKGSQLHSENIINNKEDIQLHSENIINSERECKLHSETIINNKEGRQLHSENIINNKEDCQLHSESINNTEKDSQLISLQYDDDTEINYNNLHDTYSYSVSHLTEINESPQNEIETKVDEFPDDDADMDGINMEDIDSMIDNAEIVRDDTNINSPALVKDAPIFGVKPTLTGCPGMIIDLDGSNSVAPKKLTGVELLKQRFTFFAKLKTPEEMERGREKRQKPGTLHIKLKQELEDKIAEQRSLEWAKRLENEQQIQKESDATRGDDSDAEDIDKIDAKLEDTAADDKESSAESENELLEDDVLLEDKPRKKNPLLEDEAEESDDDLKQNDDLDMNNGDENEIAQNIEQSAAESEEGENSSEEDESSESDDDTDSKPKKGRILKAFEDSDDEETSILIDNQLKSIPEDKPKEQLDQKETPDKEVGNERDKPIQSTDSQEASNMNVDEASIPNEITESQDDVLQLAQVPSTISEELFTSQESIVKSSTEKLINPTIENCSQDADLGSQTFSIINSNTAFKNNMDLELNGPEKLSVISETQPFNDNLEVVVGMCSGSFSQNFIEFKPSQSQTQSQTIGEDILDMCTGKFYDNQFLSQTEENDAISSTDMTQDFTLNESPSTEEINDKQHEKNDKENKLECNIMKTIFDELKEPEYETSKPLKYFFDANSQNKENENNTTHTQLKKKFIIDSDDEMNENSENTEQKRKKKLKKKKAEKRALQISDDEDDYSEPDGDDFLSENEDIKNDEEEKLIEYDSEENEVEIKPQNPKKKRKATEFFEQEAELTSEDEWIGSGDEDEAGLDRMEREAGDDDTFNQGRLQRELGQIHMRDVLDQDKREVRLIQELLFEDGDLGVGGRQRKFRWRNADGEEENGTIADIADTQEEEFESEEQWRKQRHEREMFLRQMKNKDEIEDELNVTVNRTTIIKANLCSRTMSSLLEEANKKTDADAAENLMDPEKKAAKDISSPKKPFSILQQNYHGSLLTRGRGALARLAALATPLAVDDDAPTIGHLAPSSKRNFVFAAIAPEDRQPKVTKRKAEANTGTPQLVKKMKIEERKKQYKNSLLDHFKT